MRKCICTELFKSSQCERRCLNIKILRLCCYRQYQNPVHLFSAFLSLVFICYTMLMVGLAELISCRDIEQLGDDGELTNRRVMYYAGGNKCVGILYWT